MKTMKGFFKVVKQSEPIKVPSQKVEGGQLDKSVVTLQELGGRNTFVCSLIGSSALCRWSPAMWSLPRSISAHTSTTAMCIRKSRWAS